MAPKYMIEQVLDDRGYAHGLQSVCFRCFNATGADPEGDIGENHDLKTHLIPIVLEVTSGNRLELAPYIILLVRGHIR